MEQPQVLIVGGSLNGLTTAALLAQQGVRCCVVERHADTTVQYKFSGISPRSMEIYRSLGLESEIRARRTGDQKSGEIARAANLSSPEIHFLGKPWADTAELSAATAETCDQDHLEPILRTYASAHGADVRFSTELIELEQDEREVRGRVRDLKSGELSVIHADYAIACDGVSGRAREHVGIGRHGPGVLQHWMNLIFESDLQPFLQGKRITSCFVTDINASIVPRADRWLLALQYSPERGEKPEDFDQARTEILVRQAAGRPDVKVRLFDARPWEVSAFIADRFSSGRVFLLGDAAHSMPPTGGFGGNTGIHDAHNLAWKLALVTQGKAGAALLETYDTERRPIAEGTLAQSLARLAAWFRSLGDRLPPPVAIRDDMDVIFGQRYPNGAFEAARDPTASVGTRAPHVIVRDGSHTAAIHDVTGNGFLLLTITHDEAWVAAARKVQQQRGVRLDVVRVEPSGNDATTSFKQAYRLEDHEAILIRPDGIIACRSGPAGSDPDRTLDEALREILAA
jgi:2-polyprenyl-6-methoxyphenol hydroxylase-like FAD-dependent oxidoreductase